MRFEQGPHFKIIYQNRNMLAVMGDAEKSHLGGLKRKKDPLNVGLF